MYKKSAPPMYDELLAKVTTALGPNREPILIGFDGTGCAGKSSAASWLAWQLGMPAIYLDLFLHEPDFKSPLQWRADEVARCLESRRARPIIAEGVLLLDVLSAIGRTPDFLIFVERLEPQGTRDRGQNDDLVDSREFSLGNPL